MRVVHIITGLQTGGAERLVYDRSHFTDHEMAVVALAEEGIFADRLRAEGVPVHFIAMRSNRDMLGLVRLTALLRRMRPDVVHVHLYRSLLFGRLAARLAGVGAVVATEHSALPDRTEGRAATANVKRLYRLAERWGRTTIAVSSETKHILVEHWGLRPERIEVVPNGVDTARLDVPAGTRERVRSELGIAADAALLLAVGRLTPGKNIESVIELLPDLPGAHLLVAGTGELADELAALARRSGVADRVHLVGSVPDVAPYYAAADVMVSTSEVETYGLALVEGYAAGLPLVYVQSPAADDLRAAFDDCRILRTESRREALLDAVRQALTLPVGREHCAPELLALVEYRDVSKRLDAIEEREARRAR